MKYNKAHTGVEDRWPLGRVTKKAIYGKVIFVGPKGASCEIVGEHIGQREHHVIFGAEKEASSTEFRMNKKAIVTGAKWVKERKERGEQKPDFIGKLRFGVMISVWRVLSLKACNVTCTFKTLLWLL